MSLSAHDIVDVRLSDAFASGGCPVCAVRARSERAALDSIITESVLDVPFRADLERKSGFCRRHVRELLASERRETGGILGSAILYGAILERRLELIRGVLGARRRSRKARLALARQRPPCLACAGGATAVETAIGRLVARAATPGWADAIADAPFCLDDLLALWAAAGDDVAFEPVARRQLAGLEALGHRLAGFVDHSAYDRRHLLTDHESAAVGDAARVLGGSPPGEGSG